MGWKSLVLQGRKEKSRPIDTTNSITEQPNFFIHAALQKVIFTVGATITIIKYWHCASAATAVIGFFSRKGQ